MTRAYRACRNKSESIALRFTEAYRNYAAIGVAYLAGSSAAMSILSRRARRSS